MQTNEYVHIQYTHIMNPSISLQPGHHYTISIKNEQSRDTGNIGHNTQNKTNKTKNTTQKTSKVSNTDPTNKTEK
jgi:hypothetical protein